MRALVRLTPEPDRRICSSMPLILISIWMAVMPLLGTGDLEVHIAQEVLKTLNIGKDGYLARFVGILDESHGRARHGTP